MKYKLTFTVVLLLLIQSLTAQIDSSNIISPSIVKNSDYWLKKAKQSRTAGWILLGAGVIVSTIVANRNYTDTGSPFDGLVAAGYQIIGTLITIACSTPFFINSAIKKKKAKLLLKQEQVRFNPYYKKSVNLNQVGITFDFNP